MPHLDIDNAASETTMREPIIPKGNQAGESFAVLYAIGGLLACDDVVGVADGKTLHFHSPVPCIFKSLDPVGRENQVKVERSIL